MCIRDRLVDVIKVTDLTGLSSLDRELALIKVRAKPAERGEILQVADVFRGRVLDVGLNCMVVELVGSPEKIDDFAGILQPYGILEIARSGLISLERSKKKK